MKLLALMIALSFATPTFAEHACAPVVEKKAKVLDEDGNEIEEPPAEEAEEPKAPKWNPADFKWTVTNRRAKNLP